MNLNELSLQETLIGIREGQFTAKEVTQTCLRRIKDKDQIIHSYISISEENLKEAPGLSETLLLGVPIAIKDNILTTSFKTTASSKVLENFIPPYNATVAGRLIKNGAFFIGKTNMDAWAHGSSTETSDFGPTLNPWDIGRLPGGSSGGSAAATAADFCIASIGTETAGSIRQPASWCGVVGLKPTYGRVPRYGIIAMASSTDCPGPITKTVWDAAYLLNIIAGFDPYDATSLNVAVTDYTRGLTDPIRGLRLGIPSEYFGSGVDQKVAEKVLEAAKYLEKMGCTLKEISLLDPKYAIAVYTIIQRSEVSSNLARYDGIRFGNDRDSFGQEAKRRIMLGTYSLSSGYYDAYYKRAEKIRTLIVEDFRNAFKEVDLIIGPVSPSVALPVGSTADQAMFGEIADKLVEPSSVAGLPGISVPCGFIDNLPVGLNIIGPQLSEELVLRLAYHYEKETEWHKMRPSF